VHFGVEQCLARQRDAVGDADVANVPAGAGGADGLHHRLLGADCLDDRVRAQAIGELSNLRHALAAAFGDDIRGAEVKRQLLARLVAADLDDPLRAELAGREDGEQADRSVTDDRDGLAGPGLGGDGAEPAGAEHVRGGQQVRDQRIIRQAGGGDKCPVGERDTQVLRLRAAGADVLDVHAPALVASQAGRSGRCYPRP